MSNTADSKSINTMGGSLSFALPIPISRYGKGVRVRQEGAIDGALLPTMKTSYGLAIYSFVLLRSASDPFVVKCSGDFMWPVIPILAGPVLGNLLCPPPIYIVVRDDNLLTLWQSNIFGAYRTRTVVHQQRKSWAAGMWAMEMVAASRTRHSVSLLEIIRH
jgi:hypothetical protein